jgi:hypothetical protein
MSAPHKITLRAAPTVSVYLHPGEATDLTLTFRCPDCKTMQHQRIGTAETTLYCATCQREPIFERFPAMDVAGDVDP